MSAAKKSFVLYVDQYQPIQWLSPEQKGRLLDAFFLFNQGQSICFDDPVLEMAFSFFKQTFERDADKYERKCRKNRDNVMRRYANAGSADGGIQTHTGGTYTDSESGSESDSDRSPPIPPPGEGEARFVPPASPAGNPGRIRAATGDALPELRKAIEEYTAAPQLRQAIEDFRKMRERIRKPMTGKALRLLFAELDSLAGQNMPEKIAILEQSVLHAWQGVFPRKTRQDDVEQSPEDINRKKAEAEKLLHTLFIPSHKKKTSPESGGKRRKENGS